MSILRDFKLYIKVNSTYSKLLKHVLLLTRLIKLVETKHDITFTTTISGDGGTHNRLETAKPKTNTCKLHESTLALHHCTVNLLVLT